VHPIGGQVFGFRALAAALDPGRPFYGLQAPGLEEYDEVRELNVSIEDLAAHYLRAIRDEFPEGPYCVGVMSFGATVAFEMGQQLHRAGEDVGLVVLMDSPAPLQAEGIVGEDYAGVIAVACHEFAHQMGGSIQLEVQDIAGRDRDDQLAHVLGLLKAQNLVSSEIDVAMMRRFIDGLHLFHATGRHGEILDDLPEDLYQVFKDPELGWGRCTSDEVVVHRFDAYHETLLREPVVFEVAARLQELIDDAAASRREHPSTLSRVGELS
jgi:thioesterase domain-containing protein